MHRGAAVTTLSATTLSSHAGLINTICISMVAMVVAGLLMIRALEDIASFEKSSPFSLSSTTKPVFYRVFFYPRRHPARQIHSRAAGTLGVAG